MFLKSFFSRVIKSWDCVVKNGSVKSVFSINPLPNGKILDWPKFKAFADDKMNVTEMMISLSNRVENTVEKRRKCRLPSFSPFPTMFSKALFFRVVECRDCVVKC